MIWIFSNAYFQSGFLPYFGEYIATIMAKVANLSSFFAFAFAYYFSCCLVASQQQIETSWIHKTIVLATAIYAVYVNTSKSLTIQEVIIHQSGKFDIHFGPQTPIFFGLVVVLALFTLYNLLGRRKKHSKLDIARNNYMVMGILIFISSTATIHIGFAYFLNNFSYTWLPPAFSISEILFVGYALITPRFYSSKYIAFKALTTTISVLTLSIILSPLVFMTHTFYESVIVAFAVVFSGVFWKHIRSTFNRLVSLFFYNSRLTPVEQILALENDFQHSARFAMEKLGELLNLPNGKLQLVTNKIEETSYSKFLQKQKSILVVDEIENVIEHSHPSTKEQLISLKKKMRSDNTALVLPLYDSNKSVSHLLMSPHKVDGGLFSREEIRALQKVIDKVQGYINADRKVSQSQALANTIAHEMRNPLAQAQLQFEQLKALVENDASTSDILSHIDQGNSAIQRGRQLIDIILREVSDSSLTNEPATDYTIRKSIRQAIGRYGFENNEVRSRITIVSGPDFVAKLNDTLFNFVLFNLLRNAIYYFDSYPEARIQISTEVGEHENCVVFRDNGPGIDPRVLPKIFEDFFTHDKNGGSGLGLGYCQRVMLSFGGRISCQSELGQFTEFRLYLPVVSQSALKLEQPTDIVQEEVVETDTTGKLPAFNRSAKVASSSNDFSGTTVLVVDDKEVQRALVKLYLEQLGVNVIQANNGLTAVSVFRSNPVDLVLMDIQMPKMNGFQACEQIRDISPTTPVIALSGECGEVELTKIEQLMDARLEKPTSKEALQNVIRAQLGACKRQHSTEESGTDFAS